MALNPFQQTMLAEMGIPIWQHRHAIPSTETGVDAQSQSHYEEDARLLKQHFIVLDSLTLDEACERLLNAILKAINLTLPDVALFTIRESDKLLEHVKNAQLVLVFADHTPIWTDENKMSVLVLPALNHLTLEPTQKKQVWQQLQAYLNLAS